MTSFRIALGELRRITAGRLPRLAVLALVLIPTLYAGLYLYANHDPYGGLERVPAALVVEDTGSTFDGKDVDFGRDVADRLLDADAFDWEEVDRATAVAGVDPRLVVGDQDDQLRAGAPAVPFAQRCAAVGAAGGQGRESRAELCHRPFRVVREGDHLRGERQDLGRLVAAQDRRREQGRDVDAPHLAGRAAAAAADR